MRPNIAFVNLPTIPEDEVINSIIGNPAIKQAMSMPLGILALSAYCRENSTPGSIEIIDYVCALCQKETNYADLEEFIELVPRNCVTVEPDIIAFSVIFSVSVAFFRKVVTVCRKIWPNAIIIAGGTHVTNTPMDILGMGDVDFICRGEGEIAFAEFVRNFGRVHEVEIQGITARGGSVVCTSGQLAKMVDELDEIPFSDWPVLNVDMYLADAGRRRDISDGVVHKSASLMTSRGCPYSCTFCSSFTVHGRKMRYRSPEHVVKEMQELYEKLGVNLFVLEDDLFVVKKDRTIELLQAMANSGIPNQALQFPNALAVNTLSEEVMDALIEAGMTIANIAIESGSSVVQKMIQKNVNLDKARQVVKYFNSKNILTRCYFIFGFPGETLEQMQETVQYAKDLNADWCTMNPVVPLVGTKMYQQFVELGYIKDDPSSWSDAYFTERTFDTPEITAKEIKDFTYRSNLDVNFLHNRQMRLGDYEKAIDIFNDVLRLHSFHIVAHYCIRKCQLALGDLSGAKSTTAVILDLIAKNDHSAEIYNKYGELMPGI